MLPPTPMRTPIAAPTMGSGERRAAVSSAVAYRGVIVRKEAQGKCQPPTDQDCGARFDERDRRPWKRGNWPRVVTNGHGRIGQCDCGRVPSVVATWAA